MIPLHHLVDVALETFATPLHFLAGVLPWDAIHRQRREPMPLPSVPLAPTFGFEKPQLLEVLAILPDRVSLQSQLDGEVRRVGPTSFGCVPIEHPHFSPEGFVRPRQNLGRYATDNATAQLAVHLGGS